MEAQPPASAGSRKAASQWLGLAAGPLFALITYGLLPDQALDPEGKTIVMGHAGRATAAVGVWMATWWMTEAIPVYATALIPLSVLPMVGAVSMKRAAAPYGHELIFLFMGGFILALAMQRWGLHRRIAFLVLRWVGTKPDHMVGGFMIATAGLSMWVSNTATSIMMLPVALSVVDLAKPDSEQMFQTKGKRTDAENFTLALLLGVAYGASIGGVGTLIGTPPNLFLASYAKSHLNIDISMVRWMGIALPLVAVFLPLTWWLLTRVLYPVKFERLEGGEAVGREALAKLGSPSRGEQITLAVFSATCFLWIFRPLLVDLSWLGVAPFSGLSDAGIAMTAALCLFVIPVEPSKRIFVMDWETAVGLPWGLLILFGGGLSLAAAIESNGIGEYLVSQLSVFAGLPSLVLVIAVVTLVIFLTELTSNTATTAVLIPLLAAMAIGLGLPPLQLAVPAAIAASCAFMLPVATPPNAVVFGTGRVPISEMCRAGFGL
ncbi:MAG: DASS family sodium-coupled anion symporter, partial [Deltaproteobacteria bacterium]|nr:DASS family sodium-coupled anion symporter [Deltaproteobacteria bacterium]